MTESGLMQDFTDRVRNIRNSLATGLVERDVAVRLALLAALSGEHLLLIGPPGTAKSLVARRLHLAFTDATCFERLLTRFSVPEELFGPLSIKGLEEDRYERLTESYLPAASIAFLDEIFKANSAILNALLTLLNEREFDNGARRERTPLMAVVGASNELPDGEELDALFDRFLLRLRVDPVSKDGFPDLLNLRGEAAPEVPEALRLTKADLDRVRKAAGDVRVPEDVAALLCDLREWCAAEEIPVSDRRWRKVVKLLQTSALTNGREAASIWDCWLLQHCLWSNAEDRMKIYDWYAARVGAVAEEPSRLVRIVNAWEGRFDKAKGERSQKRNSKGKLLFVGKNGRQTTKEKGQDYRGGKPLVMLPKHAYCETRYDRRQVDPTNDGKGYTKEDIQQMTLLKDRTYILDSLQELDEYVKDPDHWLMTELKPAMEPTKHKSAYIKQCIEELSDHRTAMESYKQGIDQRIVSFEDDIRDHLWVTDDFVEPASEGLGQARADVEKLLDRLAKAVKGFGTLPREENDDGRVEEKPSRTRKAPLRQRRRDTAARIVRKPSKT